MTDQTTADKIVADAERALAMIDDQIEDRRRSKSALGQEIALLLEDRKPLARIVSAAKGRQPKESAGLDGSVE
jgi:hypothetical protein